MNKRIWKIVVLTCVSAVLLTNLPFLPGPAWLYYPAQFFFSAGILLGLLGIVLIPTGLIWTISAFKQPKTTSVIKALAILCWVLPVISLASTGWLSDLTRKMSRNIAIANAAALVKQIEQYHQKTGAYPKTVAELTKKIPPSGIIGVFTYFYDKTPNAYTVTFTQNVLFNFNFEVVQYDPTDSHQTTGESTNLNSTGKKHWKYYIYD